MPHFRTMLTSENLCAADLWDESKQQYREAVVQIDHIKKGEVVGDKGRKKGMPFAYFANTRTGKPLGLNATNCKTLASLTGSPNVDKWKGLWITLYVTKTEVGRETVDAIRIRPEAAKAPAAKPTAPATEQDMSEADKKAVEMAEAEEARRA